jgi:parallel beta-helix repeat protein
MRTAVYAQSFVLVVAIAVSAYAGDLNPPPGPIGPTMKRLDQVEPRTPISSLPYTITESGSYYLTGNLTGVAGQNGITVIAGDVTIDLMGFTLYGVPGSLDGIGMGMLPIVPNNVTIRNGTVRDWSGNGATLGDIHMEEVSFMFNGGGGVVTTGEATGVRVHAAGNSGDGIVLGATSFLEVFTSSNNGGRGVVADKSSPKLAEGHVVGNGGDGIVLGNNATCENCTAEGNGGVGINKVIDQASPKLYGARAVGNGGDGIVLGENAICSDCTAQGNSGRGIVADKSSPKLFGCSAVGNTGGDGIVMGDNGTCENCTATNNNGVGINALDKASPKLYQALCNGNAGDGIVVGPDAILEKCTANNNTGRGIVADKSSPQLMGCSAVDNTGGDGIVLGDGGSAENCTSRGNSGNGVTSNHMIHCRQIHSEGNSGDGIVVAPGSTLTDCQALKNLGNGIHVTDNNVPAKTATTLLRGCVARSNSNMGFKIVIPPGGAVQVPTRDQGIDTPPATVAPMPLDVEKATAGASVRPARGASLAMPLASVRFAGTGFGCVAEDNLGDGFYLDGEWSLSQCVSRNNGGVGINSWSFGEAQTSSAEGNASDGFVFHGGYRMTDCTSRGNGGVGINSYSFGVGRGTVAEGNTSDGFVLRGGYVLTECTARGNGGVGIHVTDNNSPAKGHGCVAEGNGLDGFVITSGALLTGCTAQGNGTTGVGSGIRVTGTGNRLEGNHLLSNFDWGLSLFGGGNLVIGNSASGNTAGNYDIPSGNAAGPIVTSAALLSNTSPNANYDY